MISNTLEKLESLKNEASKSYSSSKSEEELYASKVHFLGKKGLLTEILKDLGKLDPKDRPLVGSKANQIKEELETIYAQTQAQIAALKMEEELGKADVDTTLPGFGWPRGNVHPLNQVLSELTGIFTNLGFDVCLGPEQETDFYNFEALNIPANHPARDMQDTFYLQNGMVLRTHTSPVQVRVMQNQKPPIRMIAPGAVFRRDSDVTHTPMFHQIEGLVVDCGINLSHLKGVIELFLKNFFSKETKVNFRPSYFPFTEPSMEVDIGCVFCNQKGCRVCKNTGWLEVMGCGMVHPEVFRSVNIDSEKYTGFAFGMGIERMTMLKLGVNDIRLFFENDPRFLKQF